MRALAEFTMRGRMQATLAVAGSAVVPLPFWLNVVAGSLVLLRRGFGDAFGVLAWAALPAMSWWYLGDPSILLVLLGTLTLAQILRASTSWSYALLGSVAAGVVFTLALGHTSSKLTGALATEVTKVPTQLRGESQLSGKELDKLQVALVPTLTGVMASSLQVTCLLCLVLVWYWQVSLYNPGGFGREFRSSRLAPAVAVILLLGAVVIPALEVQAVVLGPLYSVPLIIIDVALGYGLIVLKRLAGGWLVGLYLAVLPLGNLICPLTVADSLFNFHGRLARRQGLTNGEGQKLRGKTQTEVTLLEKVADLGNLGDKVSIRGGYARNFLLSQGKAIVATAENVAAFETCRAELEKVVAEKKTVAEARAAQFSELVVAPGAHADDEGKLFGSIGTHDIAEAAFTAGYPLEKAEIRLPSDALRNTGEFNVAVHLYTDVETTLKLTIVVG